MTDTEDTTQLVARLLRRERWLLALAAVRSELLSGGTVDEALQLVADRSLALAEADGVVLLLLDGRRSAAVRAVSNGATPLPVAATAGVSVDRGDPWMAAMVGTVGAFPAAAFPAPDQPQLAALWGEVAAVLIAPIPAGVGDGGMVICLRVAGRDPFDADQQPELVGLAEQASLALEVADRQEQRRLYELMADRERIARDLHDHVIQRLFAVGLGLQSQVAKIDQPQVAERVDQAVQQIDEAIADLRSSIFDLRSVPDGEHKKLRRRLAEIASGVGEGAPRVTVRCRGPVDTVVPPRLAEQAEAVVREGVSNAVRHSGGTNVSVTVTASDRLDIEVTDDGRGLDVGADSRSSRSGLANLADRAETFGGTFSAVGSPAGTTLRWSVPLPGERSD